MALIGLIDLEDPLDARAEAALHRALREAGVTRIATPGEAAKFDRGDRVLLVGADTLIDSAMIAAMAEGPTSTLACLPNEVDTSHYELIDGATRWAGWAALPGDMVAETAQTLDPDWSLALTLVRRAVQHGALRVDAGRAGALIDLSAGDAVAAIDEARLRTAMRPKAGICGRIVERAALFIADTLLGVEHNLRWIGGATAALLGGFGAALAYGWIAPAAVSFILLTISTRAWRGLTLVAGRPLPWLDHAVDAAALAGLAAATGWAWTSSGQWGVVPLAIVLAADTAMAAEDEADAAAPLWWRGDPPAYAAILLAGSLAGHLVPALVAATVYASASFAVARRRLRVQRLSIET
ncbi:hypothetical protein SPAN111604_08905 [Sphingomonas antarctica]|uniref:hypothetical protein n=1 Tax=Sphingomonas antarctica TaxID=2040274 RepID=UPI0039EB74D7